MNPADKRLAVMVDDHLLSYFDYEGIIPAGQYGSGAVVKWDAGAYTLLEGNDSVQALEKGKIVIQLHGKVLKGGFSLVKMKGRGEKNWLLIKKKDEHSRADWAIERALTEERKNNLRELQPPCEVY
jgi:bifunctional non-homologous end joining protein LigD